MPTTTNSAEAEKYKKLRRTILAGVLISAVIIGWHLYEFFVHGKGKADRESAKEHEIHEFTQHLFADELKPSTYNAHIMLGGKTNSHDRDDHAKHPFLDVHYNFNETNQFSTTYLLSRLYDNYELDTHAIEHVTEEEVQEEYDFLAAVLKTSVMKKTMKYMQEKGFVSADPKLQMKLLHDIWFTQYSRNQGRVGSSGFEHVFLAEIKDHNILGLHNWIYFFEQEKTGNLDYKGFIEHVDFGKDKQQMFAVRFSFHNIPKPYNTLFVGTSPELELSMYTLCFVMSMDQPCPVQFGKTKFTIYTHSWNWNGKKVIGSAYPSFEA